MARDETSRRETSRRETSRDAAVEQPMEPAAVRALLGAAAPAHVAVIMDGNGRWARSRGLPRIAGHRRGVEAVRSTIRAAGAFGVKHLTLFAFSTENWRRPREEVVGLMALFRTYIRREADALAREGARVRFIGEPDALPADIQALMAEMTERTAKNERLDLTIALNYGARAEIARAARRLAEEAASGARAPESVDEAALGGALQTADLPDVDLVVRTSGEQRLSNFLLWQAAYAELVFAPEAWPEFNRDAFVRALRAYAARERRFGAAGSPAAPGSATVAGAPKRAG